MNKKNIKTKNTKQHKDKNLIIFLWFVIILITIFLGLIFFSKFRNSEEKNTYNGFDFYYDENDNLWYTMIEIQRQPYVIPFYYHPREVEHIFIQENVEEIVLQKPLKIIISVPPNLPSSVIIAGMELSKITSEAYNILNIPTTPALNQKVSGHLFADCRNASESIAVINFEAGHNNIITGSNNCINIEFNYKKGANESIKVADALAYKILKIII